MTDRFDEDDESPRAAEMGIARKRRKIRKGTSSCWECKRRKIRCIFASSEESVCAGCEHRKTPCISQDEPEDASPAVDSKRRLGERMTRIEDAVKEILVGQRDPPFTNVEQLAISRRPSLQAEYTSGRAPLTPRENLTFAEITPKSSSLPTPPAHSGQDASAGNAASRSSQSAAVHHLLEALPTEHDVQVLLRESARPSWYTSIINTQPHAKVTIETLAPPYPVAQHPSSDLHAVTLARCLLMFAITLQSPSGEDFLNELTEAPNLLGLRMADAASTWVTTRSETHDTVDGLLCIMLEGIFKVNCGNLRQAWGVYRRAMTVAQMLGLHRSPIPPFQRIDQALTVNPAFMWFRIVYMDRYLSLLLGLPQGSTDRNMASLSILQHESPLGQFERQLAVIASRILERNENAVTPWDISTTQAIDQDLLDVSENMPADFWRPVNFHNLVPGSPENLLEVVRLAAQVYYNGLLVYLHLPYMIHEIGGNGSTEHAWSKMTCINASREILTRFIAHRSFRPVASCSRPVDFFALLAAITLTLAHFDAHRLHTSRSGFNILAHQRLSDRAMLEQALEKMAIIRDVSKDAMTEKSAQLIRRLLDIEADAARGSNYTARNLNSTEYQAQNTDPGQGEDLDLHIPYYGVIKIARQCPISVQRTSALENPLSQAANLDQSHGLNMSVGSVDPTNAAGYAQSSGFADVDFQPDLELPSLTAGVEDWALQGVDMAFFDSLLRGVACPNSAGSD